MESSMRAGVVLVGCVVALGSVAAAAPEDWPRTVEHPNSTIVMYQPQIERLSENDVEARAAVSVSPTDSEEVYFGAVWLTARVEIDRDSRTVAYREIRVPRVRFPEATEEQRDTLARLFEQEMPAWELEDSLDLLLPLLELAEHEQPHDPGLNNDPPRIVVARTPSVLVLFDGTPRFRTVSEPEKARKKEIQRALNTPFTVVYHPGTGEYYLHGGGELWYGAASALGPYAPLSKVPKVVRQLAPDEDEGEDDDSDTDQTAAPPAVVTATEPTELIVVDGEPELAPVGDLDLLYTSNADRDILVDTTSRTHYVLLAGRWYSSPPSLDGPWTFVPPQELPEGFADIPADSEVAHVRAHVPGTVEAQEAVLDSTIPQTAAIRRDDRSVTVHYDGSPRFERVDGAGGVEYAVNSPQSVLKVGSTYYCCEQAVWYQSPSATGPWRVCTAVPDAVYDIPPSNPHHNVTYVRVYDVTPEVVHVGYTPGYVGSYVSGGCVVYGTGWRYSGWFGSHYYPRPSTWGFHATYNPWSGWGFGVSWSSGPFRITFGTVGWGPRSPYHSWWGPWGWRPYYPPYYPGFRPPYPGYRPPGYYPPPTHLPAGRPPAGSTRPPGSGGGAQPRPGTPAQLPAAEAGAAAPRVANNLYAREGNAGRNAARPSTRDVTRPATADNRPNDVFTDRSGNVYRRDQQGGWEQRRGGGWRPSTGDAGQQLPGAGPGSSTRPATRPSPGGQPSTLPSTGSLDRDYGARSRGKARSGQFRSSRASRGGAARPAARPGAGAARRR
jgi:hypothetical protein